MIPKVDILEIVMSAKSIFEQEFLVYDAQLGGANTFLPINVLRRIKEKCNHLIFYQSFAR